MKNRRKRATHATATNRRKKQRATLVPPVKPVAIKTESNSAEAVIPASIRKRAGAAEAVITVEVNSDGRRRKRAAAIPVTVRKPPTAITTHPQWRSEQSQTMRPSHEQVPVQPRAQVLELVNDLINHEERALHSLIDYSEKGMAVVRYLFSPWYPGTSEPRQPKAGGRVLQWRTPRGRSATAKAA